MQETFLLEMKNIHKQFPGVYALQGMQLTLRAGEVHALLGENGAGKSTLIKILGGIYSIDQGELFKNGQKMTINNVRDAQKQGISIIHQELVLVPEMTVAENIFLGREVKNAWGGIDSYEMEKQAQILIDLFALPILAHTKLKKLTLAHQQMIEIIKAVSVKAQIIVMDEPTSSLSDKESEFLFQTIAKLKMQGVGIIYISHRMSELDRIADRVTILRDGQYIETCIVKDTSPHQWISLMVGRELTSYYTRTYQKDQAIVLEVKELKRDIHLPEVSFNVKKGEILGFAGLVGAGRTQIMRCLFGIDSYISGQIEIEQQKVTIASPMDAIHQGLALVPESRKDEGLFLEQSVKYNLTLGVLDQFVHGFWVDQNKEETISMTYVEGMSIKTPNLEEPIQYLSGGNQQKVIISRWLATNPKVLILDEPTRGVDVGAKAEIYALMNQLVSQGMAIIMVSSDLPEIINMSDRVAVMCHGGIAGILAKEDVNQEKIMHLATKIN